MKLTRKEWILLAAAMLLLAAYVIFFTDWFKTRTIHISHTVRPTRQAVRFALDTGAVLGHTIAHEVGHLLLPRGTHGPAGLMRATWRMEDMRDAAQGHLGFSPAEAAIIRARLAARNALNPD